MRESIYGRWIRVERSTETNFGDVRMTNLRGNMPPAALVGDDLINTFGEYEMEVAVQLIVKIAVQYHTWYVFLRRNDFSETFTSSSHTLHGFDDLVAYGWLEPAPVSGMYRPTEAMVKRLLKKRPQKFGRLYE
jgi:hypothetical protein